MANTILPGYEMPIGEKVFIVFDHTGPASYVLFVSPSTGGDAVNASDLGRGGFDFIDSDMTDPLGQVYAQVQPVNGGNGNAIPSVRLIWYSLVTATIGGQAQTANTQIVAGTNLSAIALRLRAMCV